MQDQQLAKKALELGWITTLQLQECLLIQNKLQPHTPMSFSQVLLKKRYLSSAQIAQLSKAHAVEKDANNQSVFLKPGEFSGHYQIEKHIGSGGMGIVYKALDTQFIEPLRKGLKNLK